MKAVTREESVANLVKARDAMKALMSSREASKFKMQSEECFSSFRQAVVHLRRDREALDSVTEKEVTWRFLCRFAQEVPFQHGRCSEVLRYLLISDCWVKAFADDPNVEVDKLPPAIKEEFEKRLKEVEKDPSSPPKAVTPVGTPRKSDPWSEKPKDGYPQAKNNKTDPWSQPKEAPEKPGAVGGMPQLCVKSMSLVVQRCLSATIANDEGQRNKGTIGPGLVVSVSMADGAKEEGVMSAAQFILTSKLSGKSGWFPGSKGMEHFGDGAASVASLCKAGFPQGIMVVPQPSLVADIQDGRNVTRDLAYKRSQMQTKMYNLFVETLQKEARELIKSAPALEDGSAPGRSTVPEVVAGEFGKNVFMDMKSAGPFMHSFQF